MKPYVYRTLIAAIALTATVCANAQSMLDMPTNANTSLGVTMVNVAPILNVAPTGGQQSPLAPPVMQAASPAELATLRFHSSDDVHAQVLRNVTRFLAQGDAAKTKQTEQILARNDPLGQFDKLLKQYGYDSHDLADVFTAYLILSWEVVNGTDSRQTPQGIVATRVAMQDALAGNQSVRTLADADKQKLAETMAYLSIIAAAAQNDLVSSGDRASLAQMREGVRRTTMSIVGVDLKGIRLTDAGFGG
jgi:hypothetical protein